MVETAGLKIEDLGEASHAPQLMKLFFFKNKYLIAALIVCAIWFVWFGSWSQSMTTNPLDEPILLAPRGTIEKAIYVPIPERYRLSLVFEPSDMPFQQLEQLLGKWLFENGKQIPSGIEVPIRWSVLSEDSRSLVLHGEAKTYGIYSSSAFGLTRLVGEVKLKPGYYIFRAEILRDVPELAQLKAHLSISADMKSASTWQLLLVWIGGIARYYVVVPLMTMLAVALLGRAVWRS